jgi:hypothetical protein
MVVTITCTVESPLRRPGVLYYKALDNDRLNKRYRWIYYTDTLTQLQTYTDTSHTTHTYGYGFLHWLHSLTDRTDTTLSHLETGWRAYPIHHKLSSG